MYNSYMDNFDQISEIEAKIEAKRRKKKLFLGLGLSFTIGGGVITIGTFIWFLVVIFLMADLSNKLSHQGYSVAYINEVLSTEYGIQFGLSLILFTLAVCVLAGGIAFLILRHVVYQKSIDRNLALIKKIN